MNVEQYAPGTRNPQLLVFGGLGRRSTTVVQLAIIVASLVLGTTIVYSTGGTGYAYPYVLLLPIILTAAWFGPLPTLLSALFAGLLLGPYMPLDVDRSQMQSTENWVARVCFFIVIAAFTSWLFQGLRKATRLHLEHLQIDRDTGLPNQAALKEDLGRLLSSDRYDQPESGSLAILFVRLNDLWEVMEAMGTPISDAVVRQMASRLTQSVPVGSRIYRFSTSELLLTFSASSHAQVDRIAKAVRSAGEHETDVDGISVRVQLVAGSYFVEKNMADPDIVINRARTALLSALDANSFYRAYEPAFDHKATERVRLISNVRKGLKAGQFTLYYQPKICLKTGRQSGGEGLLRWFRSDGTMVLPGLFMPKLENTTLIDPVTRFVIRQACEDVKTHKLESLSINFSAKNLMDTALVQNMGRIVSVYGVDPENFEIEITEGALIRDPAHAKVAIQSLRNQGFRVSLDDFGTGYSSFQYLTHLPLSGLKIDRAFVIDLEESAHARTVMKSMISMAHALNLHVTVEGIETAEQHDIVSSFGADTAQGFYYSKPIPVSDYARWNAKLDVDLA